MQQHTIPNPREYARHYFDQVPTHAIAVDEPWWWPVLSLGVDLINVHFECGYRGPLAIVSSAAMPWERSSDCQAIEAILRADGRPTFDAYRCPKVPGRIVGMVDVVDSQNDSSGEGLWFSGPYALKVQNQCLLPFAHSPTLGVAQGLIALSDEKRSSLRYALTRLASGAEPGEERKR